MLLNFNDFYSMDNIEYDKLGEINESHEYANHICSVMDKVSAYAVRNYNLSNSNLNESAKRAFNRNVYFSKEEKVAVSCIFNEMLKNFKENMDKEVAVYESIISKGSLLEEGVEYDLDEFINQLSLNEGIKDWLKDKYNKGKDAVKNTAKTVLDKTSDLSTKGVKIVKATKDNLVTWAKEAKKDLVERFLRLSKLISKIVKDGINTVKDFINTILDAFVACGDNLVDAVKSFGGLKMDDGEKLKELTDIDTSELYKNVKGKEEKSFFNNIVIRVQTMLSKDKNNSAKIMVEESLVDNKFIAFLAGYKNDGEKMNWWKCILIGLCASVIVWLLPHVLVFVGVGGAIAAFITALVGCIWNGIGLLKLIYKRNKERKPGEKFFDKKTAIFFTISILAFGFSVATFVKTIGPMLTEICNAMGWTGGEDMGAFGELIFKIAKKLTPDNAFHDGVKEMTEEIQNIGGDVRDSDIVSSMEDAKELIKNMEGATDAQKDAFIAFLDAAKNAKGSIGVYDALKEFIKNGDLPYTAVFDTSKWGGSGPIAKAIEILKDNGSISDSAILGTLGSEVTSKASKGLYGMATYITGATKEETALIFQKAAEIAGKDASSLQFNEYGTGIISTIISTVEKTPGYFDVLTPNLPVLPMVMPFFDKKEWGKYKMRFASSTRGAASYVVDKVEMIPGDKLKGDSPALSTLKELHNKTWEGVKNSNKEKEKVEEPQYIVFYVDESEETGNENDKVKKKDGEKSSKEPAVGVAIDTLTMMCADVCDFNESVKRRRRPQPYFMKGLFSRLSFRPVESNDNETKDYIRTTLGKTMKTLIMQCVLYGSGKKYFDSEVKGKKATFELRKTILGDDKKKIEPTKNVFELGNFSPNELLLCLNDESKNNKEAYKFLDGDYASRITIKKNEDGSIKSTSASHDGSTIENIKYYRISKESYEYLIKQWEDGGKEGKKPSKPIIGEDGKFYKRMSKKMMSDSSNSRKKTFDYVDIRIIPLLKKGELHEKFMDNKLMKKLLYDENGKINKKSMSIIRPFLLRPEKSFSREDEHGLNAALDKEGIEGEKLGWFKNLFKDEKQLHDVLKEVIEIIWDYISENRRSDFKKKDLKKNHGKTNEEFEYDIDDLLLEDYEYDDNVEYKYDMFILKEEKRVIPTFEMFIRNY